MVLPSLFDILSDKIIDQQRDVFPALPKRRHGDRENIQPVPEILPERSLVDLRFKIAIGGGDDADIDFYRVGTAQAFKLAGLDDLEQLGLQIKGQFADLIQKQGGGHWRFRSGLIVWSAHR